MGLKLRQETSTATITADDIHVRTGGTSGTQISFGDNDIANLGFETGSDTTEKNFKQFHNKWKMVTGDYFNTTGYVESFQGGGNLGSMTENVMASANDGGWYLGTSATEGRITELTADTTSGASTIMNFKVINNANDADTGASVGWSVLTIRTNNLGGDVIRNKASYASFNSSGNKYQWSSSAGNQSVLGTTSGLTRFLQLD
jgi:hypothetical protein